MVTKDVGVTRLVAKCHGVALLCEAVYYVTTKRGGVCVCVCVCVCFLNKVLKTFYWVFSPSMQQGGTACCYGGQSRGCIWYFEIPSL
jgi:hypothetical protein